MAAPSLPVAASLRWGVVVRWLRCVVLVVGTLFVCSTMATAAGPKSGGRDFAVDAGAHASTLAALGSGDTRALRDGSSRPCGLPEGMTDDLDDDDDDDPMCGVVDGAAVSFRRLSPPRRPDHVRRAAISVDTSRFVAGPGLPRGPPVIVTA